MKVSDRNTIQIRRGILNFIVVRPRYDDIGSATRAEKIVIDAALDHFSHATAENQILLLRVKSINRDASQVCTRLDGPPRCRQFGRRRVC